MRDLVGLMAICILCSIPYSALADGSTEEIKATKTLFHCGEGSENGFNGWTVKGLNQNAHLYFEQKHLEIFSHQSGECSLELTKKIDDMVGFTDINISFDLEELNNCSINYATAYLSSDGKNWKAINSDANNESVSARTEKMDCSFIKLVANITFFKEGRMSVKRAFVTGSYNKNPKPEIALIKTGPAAVQVKEMFLVFDFENKINIETQNDEPYEFVLTNLAGQIVQREKSIGSTRFETEVSEGIYIVSIIQNNKLITTKKVAL